MCSGSASGKLGSKPIITPFKGTIMKYRQHDGRIGNTASCSTANQKMLFGSVKGIGNLAVFNTFIETCK